MGSGPSRCAGEGGAGIATARATPPHARLSTHANSTLPTTNGTGRTRGNCNAASAATGRDADATATVCDTSEPISGGIEPIRERSASIPGSPRAA